MTLFLRIVAAVNLAHILVDAVCLPDAIPAARRKNLTNSQGQSYPLGFVQPSWASADVAGAIIEIIVEEILGYNIRAHPQKVQSSGAGIYALLGCQDFANLSDRGCARREHRLHIMVENWIGLYQHIMDELALKYKEEMPRSGGYMGLQGVEGMYVPGEALAEAQQDLGLALEYYKSWNSTWHRPSKYFDNVSSVDTALLMLCTESLFDNSATVGSYFHFSGDVDGVVQSGGSYRARCDDGYWWLAPSCRHAPEMCVPYVTGGDGWAIAGSMQKIGAFGMPVAMAVAASWDAFTAIPIAYRVLFFWWEPDNAFLTLNPTMLAFPRFNKQAFERQDYTSQAKDIQLVKLVSYDLGFLAGDVADFLESSEFALEDIKELMLEKSTSGESREVVACRWLLGHEGLWRGWIPDSSTCFSGFGLFNESTKAQAFVQNRRDKRFIVCRACPPGTYSEPLSDDLGTTFVCADCPAGFHQPNAAASFCQPCAKGTYKDAAGREECQPCPFSSFEDAVGSTQCKNCPQGTTTQGLGSWSAERCGCMEGHIELARAGENVSCSSCCEGMLCPPLSTLQGLKEGLGPAKLLVGYWSAESDVFRVFKCANTDHCPGGKPGTCEGGRVTIACASCPSGTRWNTECVDCEAWLIGLWVMVLCSIFLLLPLVGRKGREVSERAYRDLRYCLTEVLAITAQVLQTFAIIRMMTVQWPASFLDALLSFFLLEVDDLGLSCVLGQEAMTGYVLQAGFLPIACFWIVLCTSLMKPACGSRLLREGSRVASANACGLLMQNLFEMGSNFAMAPFMCYTHPNGSHSVLRYPSIMCETGDHFGMVLLGSALGLLLLAFLAICIWAARNLPRWSSSSESRQTVAAFRFLFDGFRPNSWWYGIPVLVIGSALSLPTVVATDSPVIQVVITSVLLATHLLFLLLTWPWKVPLVNLVETLGVFGAIFSALSASLFLPVLDDASTSYASSFALVVRMIVLGSFSFLLVLLTATMLRHKWSGKGRAVFWIELAFPQNVKDVIKVLTETAMTLSTADHSRLEAKISKLGSYDQKLLMSATSLLVMEVLPERTNSVHLAGKLSSRIRSSNFMAELKAAEVDLPEEKEGPGDVEEPEQDTSLTSSEPEEQDNQSEISSQQEGGDFHIRSNAQEDMKSYEL